MNLRVMVCGSVIASAVLGSCAHTDHAPARASNPALRPIQAPAGAAAADADRAALARFIGVWNFSGTIAGTSGERSPVGGIAAATIENEHFVLLDIHVTGGELAGRVSRKSGSMILASEPGVGMTLTAWGDASPTVSRLVGTTEGDGSFFTFRGQQTSSGTRPVSIEIAFETDDRWTVTIRDVHAANEPAMASYVFTRAAK